MAEDRPDYTPDDFEIHRMKWTAHASILESSRKAVEMFDLDPSLLEALEDAEREQDGDAFIEAVADLWEAAAEAKGLL